MAENEDPLRWVYLEFCNGLGRRFYKIDPKSLVSGHPETWDRSMVYDPAAGRFIVCIMDAI